MYNVIYAPKGYHGILGRRIQKELEIERTERCLNAKFRQLVYHDDGVTCCNPAVDEPLEGASNEGSGPTPDLSDIVEEIQSK